MRICIRCGQTDETVSFTTLERKDGTLYHYRQCTGCVWKRNKARLEANKEGTILKGRRDAAKRPMRDSVWVLWCPNGDYPRDSYFNNSEFRETLNEGYWPLGMLVKIKEQKYAVCGSGVMARTWKQLGYPLNIEWPEQTLAEVNGRARV